MDQGIGTFAGVTVLGVDFPHCRGVYPSTAKLSLAPVETFDRQFGSLILTFGSGSQTFTGCAVVSVTQDNFVERQGFRWSVLVNDRRWRWRYPRISGRYNRRLCDGSVDPVGKKSARDLATLLVNELGDTIDVGDVPNDVYPPVVWEDAVAALELAWLCDLLGLDVYPQIDNTFTLKPIMQTASLPAGGEYVTPPAFSHKPAVMPSRVQVQGDTKWQQGWIPLQAIGLDVDGKYNVINSLSYNPGWGTQWWHTFPDVDTAARHLSFGTVFRLYAPVDPTIILGDHLLEVGLDVPADRKRCLPSRVRGAFCSHDDFATTTSATTSYNGEFTFRKDLNALAFEYPVFRIVGGAVQEAQLQVNTSYYIVDADGNPTTSFESHQDVDSSVTTTKPRVLKHPELGEREILAAIFTATGSNSTDIIAEAQSYLTPVAATYSYANSKDAIYDRLIFPQMTAGMSQIKWMTGNGMVATTRIGVNTEIDWTNASRAQRRAQQRLFQMAERMVV